MEDSKYQKAIYGKIVDTNCNIIISAVAGSGKTTTLVNGLKLIPKDKKIVFLAFNNAIVDTLKKRIEVADNITISTMHSLGWRHILKHFGGTKRITMDNNKCNSKIDFLLKKHNVDKKKRNYYFYILNKAVDIARHSLATTAEQIEELADRHDILLSPEEIAWTMLLLKQMREDTKKFDFTDMIHYPATHDIKMFKYDYVFVDESQDLSVAQQEIIKKIKLPKGRLIAVGDPSQAIYGFAGADANSYNNLATMFPDTIQLPLSVSYRCAQRIVQEASKINSQIKPYEGNEKGEVREGSVDEIKMNDWVLCRNLKPLVLMNMYLLSINKKSYIRGKDIGLTLISLVSKTHCDSIKSMFVKLKFTLEKEKRKYRNFGITNVDNVGKIAKLMEKIDILAILSHNLKTTKQLKDKINKLFDEDTKAIMLSTIHKCKGLENNRIFFLCPELIPSKYAIQEWQLTQETNLHYVCITRAKKSFITINDFEEKIKAKKKELDELLEQY